MLNTGKWIKADRADRKPGKGRYRCLDGRCARDLTVARSKYGRQHFRHFRNSHAEGCCFQSIRSKDDRHRAAQALLQALFSEALKRNIPMPMLVFDTANGRREVLPFISAAQVVTEWECPISKRKADVALLDDEGRAVLLVEVWHTHAVDLEKRMDLSPYWWIEVEASQVLADPTALSSPKSWESSGCAGACLGAIPAFCRLDGADLMHVTLSPVWRYCRCTW